MSIKTDMYAFELETSIDKALVIIPQYYPFDDKLTLKIEGIYGSLIPITVHHIQLFDFDPDRYDNKILVNGVPANITSNDENLYFVINMTEHGWPPLDMEQALQKAKDWYVQLYGQQFIEEYGKIPISKYERYMSKQGLELASYHDAVLEVEIPLIVHDKDKHYTGSHPDIGWCREPKTLVAKTSSIPNGVCVMPDTATELIRRGWAQEIPKLSDHTVRELETLLAERGVQYMPDRINRVDSFRAAIMGLAHVDDVRVLETTPGISYREWDAGLDIYNDNMQYLDALSPVHKCRDHVWNSPEPIDKRILQARCPPEESR